MYVDASALCAIFLEEPDAIHILSKMRTAERLVTSSTGVWEAVVSCSRQLGNDPLMIRSAVMRYLEHMTIDIVPIPAEAASLAIDAYTRFGKGRTSGSVEFRRLLCLCLCQTLRRSDSLQGRRLRFD